MLNSVYLVPVQCAVVCAAVQPTLGILRSEPFGTHSAPRAFPVPNPGEVGGYEEIKCVQIEEKNENEKRCVIAFVYVSELLQRRTSRSVLSTSGLSGIV